VELMHAGDSLDGRFWTVLDDMQTMGNPGDRERPHTGMQPEIAASVASFNPRNHAL
jgi:hypothetical protein